jgi:hypothetical protein
VQVLLINKSNRRIEHLHARASVKTEKNFGTRMNAEEHGFK